jgi:hypothetical protein
MSYRLTRQINPNVLTWWYETNPGWMLLTHMCLQKFQINLWLNISLLVQAEILLWFLSFLMVSLLSMDWSHRIHTYHDPEIQCQNVLFWVGTAHISCVFALSLLFDILDKWNINNQCSISCVRTGHVMLFLVFLIVFCVLVCSRWSKYSC